MPPADREPLLQALAAAIREPGADARVEADADAFLCDFSLAVEDRRGLASRGGLRLAAYRQLVHNRLRNVVRDWIPRTADRLGTARLTEDVAQFIASEGVHAPYLRDVPSEFVAWAAPRWHEDPHLLPFLPDLARYELLRNDVRNDPRGGETPTGQKLELEWPVRCDGTARVLRFEYAIHKLPRAPEDRTAPAHAPVHLAIFRNRRDAMMYKEVSATEAAVLRRLLDHQTMRDAVIAGCADVGAAVDDIILGEIAVLLARLSEIGFVLGGEPPAEIPSP